VPHLRTIGGRPVKELGRDVDREVAATLSGLPVHFVSFSVRYDVDGYIAEQSAPHGPLDSNGGLSSVT